MAHSTKIELESLFNTRDLGGLIGLNNRKIRSNCLIRSGNLSSVSTEDLEKLYADDNLRTIIDLRNATEARQSPDKYLEKMEYICLPILDEAQMGMTHEKEMDAKDSELHFVSSLLGGNKGLDFMTGLYKNFIDNPRCQKMYSQFVRTIINSRPGAVLYHCSVGKDRVGVGTFILLSLLGVDTKDIEEDFMLTNDFIEPAVVNHISNLSKSINDSSLEKTYRDLFTVRKEYIDSVIRDIDSKYGGFLNFAHAKLELSDEDITRLQEKYLEK